MNYTSKITTLDAYVTRNMYGSLTVNVNFGTRANVVWAVSPKVRKSRTSG